MGYERYPRIAGSQGEYFGSRDPQSTDRSGYEYRSGGHSSAREYAAAGEYDRDQGGYRDSQGPRDGGRQNYRRDRGFEGAPQGNYRGSYASDGHRFTQVDDDAPRGNRQGYGRQPQGYDYDDRGFMDRAGDEVRSWFGDEDAERRRDMDARYDERQYGNRPHARDDDYHSWRRGQIDALDRDYHEYRQENRAKFDNEFGSWRQERQTQRGSLTQVAEHMDVLGSDGEHVGTVDKVRGDRILLTKSDAEAGGRHHSIPSRWIDKVDGKVTLRKTAEEAKGHWRDEERNQAFFGEGENGGDRGDATGPHMLNRSFSGTY